jgi:hypothetical protein
MQLFQQAPEEVLDGSVISPLMHKDLQPPVLIHCTPEIMQHAPDSNECFIKMPRVPGPQPPVRNVSVILSVFCL